MAGTKINNTGVTFSDATVQTTAVVAGQLNYTLYTSGSGTWTCPAGVTKILAIVIGGGAGWSGSNDITWGRSGGIAIGIYTVVPSTNYAYIVGAASGGTGGYAASGGTSSFASFCSATGGQNALGSPGLGFSGNLSNWHVPDYSLSPGNSFCVGGIFVGAAEGFSTVSGNWAATHGNIPGASGTSISTYGGGGVIYIQYIG